MPEKKQRISSLSVMISNPNAEDIIKEALVLESGRFVARDIGVGDPERMAPSSVEAYIKPLFDNLKVTVIDDVDVINKEYPLFGAVNRAANAVKRHQGRIIYLEYVPPVLHVRLCCWSARESPMTLVVLTLRLEALWPACRATSAELLPLPVL